MEDPWILLNDENEQTLNNYEWTTTWKLTEMNLRPWVSLSYSKRLGIVKIKGKLHWVGVTPLKQILLASAMIDKCGNQAIILCMDKGEAIKQFRSNLFQVLIPKLDWLMKLSAPKKEQWNCKTSNCISNGRIKLQNPLSVLPQQRKTEVMHIHLMYGSGERLQHCLCSTEWIKIFRENPSIPPSFLKLNTHFNPTQCWWCVSHTCTLSLEARWKSLRNLNSQENVCNSGINS